MTFDPKQTVGGYFHWFEIIPDTQGLETESTNGPRSEYDRRRFPVVTSA